MASLPMARPAPARLTVASAVAGVGVYIPPSSARLAAHLTGSECTGVSNRVQSEQGLSTPSLAAGAARAALRAASARPDEIQLIVVGTTSPDVLWPATACLVQTELGLPMVASFDLYAAEAGLLTALNVANLYIESGTRAALVIGAESDNQLVDLPGQSMGRHGRAASAVVLRHAGTGGDILASVVGGARAGDGGGSAEEAVLMRGLRAGVDHCLERAGLSLADIDLVIGEQTAPEVMRAWARMERLQVDRLVLEPDRYAFAFAAAPFIVLHDLVKGGRLRSGMVALLLSCGTGPAWAVTCLRWGNGAVAAW